MPPIERVDLLVDFRFQRRIAADVGARRHTDLQERQAAAQLGTARDNFVERRQPLRNALGVVEPIHADADDVGVQPEQARAAAPVPPASAALLGELLNAVVVDANRHRDDAGVVPPDTARATLSQVDLGAELLLRRLQEVPPIALELERQQVVGEQAREDLAAPRADAKPIR